MHLSMSSPRWGGGGGGGGGRALGGDYTFFLKKKKSNPYLGQNINVKIIRNKWFSSLPHLPFEIDRLNA